MASVRARRPPSPPPSIAHPPPRFPPKAGHLDADARRAAPRSLARPRVPAAAEWRVLAVLLLVGAGVRLFRISSPDSVVFDEVHFGKFAARYIKTRYFVDVHPPLAKLLITLAAWIFGFNGHFEFDDIAKPFVDTPYVAMRMVPALMGLWTIPLGYLTLRMLDCRATTAMLAAVLLTFENALVTQSRHILLDAPLIFFTALSTFFYVCFATENARRPFSEAWWTWLVLTGGALGAVVSCKWVGLFTIALVGLATLRQLWILLGDTRVSPRLWIKHFLARALCLILVPLLVYMFIFHIHFAILQNSGEGDGFMSPEFQHTLGGHRMDDTYADVAVGSRVTIRHVNTQGGYLHSHPHNYPAGSKQQQITLYPHLDENNDWRIINASSPGDPYTSWEGHPPAYIPDGARIKLRHISTAKSLHSHDFRPPVSDVDFQNEVSAYGMADFEGDMNDDWIVEIDGSAARRLRTLRTAFRLKHALTGCYLFSHKVKLPAWGFDQQEVTCNKNAVRANSLWMVETNWHPHLPANAPKVNYRTPSLLSKFLELNSVMWTTNAGLTERHTYDSRPASWPILRRGINFWVKDHRQVYLTGNPLVWWMSTAAVSAYVAVRALLILRAKRGFRDFENTKVVKYDTLCGFLFLGWALHYLPFFLMTRQLFLHHYLPALYFAVLLLCAVFDFLTASLRPVARLAAALVLALLVVWNFAIFSPLAYGLPWTKAQCRAAQWRSTWDFSWYAALSSPSQYLMNLNFTPPPQCRLFRRLRELRSQRARNAPRIRRPRHHRRRRRARARRRRRCARADGRRRRRDAGRAREGGARPRYFCGGARGEDGRCGEQCGWGGCGGWRWRWGGGWIEGGQRCCGWRARQRRRWWRARQPRREW
ncbi:Dolichyl-phosphate-mannose-protein mannosyltransferase-domain-containing protein [Vararia minispora EC-137]|uniref:Dolichyl-phosphate-mannose-protein mannosyltransferase-domain-containing protein n=1 Tax=Vararia minispora EC-137 TaxID=1314806 RepID=A0ACB8Q6H1_9AGAM|nr:Dolichyl-phosphate-mannose-protein mannosyltransferase-domain-containing protein [Vararia minispora EC-137]